jgi:hypothetical protein
MEYSNHNIPAKARFPAMMNLGNKVKPHDRMPLLVPRLLETANGLQANEEPFVGMNDRIFAEKNLVHTRFSQILVEYLPGGNRPTPGAATFLYVKQCVYEGIFANCHGCWNKDGGNKRKNFAKVEQAPFPGRVSHTHPNLTAVGLHCGCVVCNECIMRTERKIHPLSNVVPCTHCGNMSAFPKNFRFWICPETTIETEMAMVKDSRGIDKPWSIDHYHHVGGGPY